MSTKKRRTRIYETEWNGFPITVRYTPKIWNGFDKHEIVIRKHLPGSYLSSRLEWLEPGAVEKYGGPVGYALYCLDCIHREDTVNFSQRVVRVQVGD